MIELKEIDPLAHDIPTDRCEEFGRITLSFSSLATLTVRQEKTFEQLLTSAYIAGYQDAAENLQ